MTWRSLLLVVCLLALARPATAEAVSVQAQTMIARIDSLDVEHHWPAGVHVNWKTGEPDGRPETSPGKHTHCSAFVAAAAMTFGVYILRPPEHPQIMLANAQYDWLVTQGATQGWRELDDGAAAQDYANRGYLVMVAYKNHDPTKPGHIAIVRPSDKSLSMIRAEGPQITQAGGTNYASASFKEGFSGHPAAFAKGEARFFAHTIEAGPR